MKIKNLFLFQTVLILVTCFAGCSKEVDTPTDPAGSVTLNMMKESYGKTELGISDVYINDANNFYSSYCLISSLGTKNGLGSISDMFFTTGSNTAAVIPGHAYQIFTTGALREFPSGKLALNIQSDYYNVFVDSQIKEDDEAVGAVVKFILMDIPDNGLPQYDTHIGTLDHLDWDKYEIEIELPTSDFEYDPDFGNVWNEFEHEKEGNKLIVRLIKYNGYSQELGIYIRINDSYTFVYGNVK